LSLFALCDPPADAYGKVDQANFEAWVAKIPAEAPAAVAADAATAASAEAVTVPTEASAAPAEATIFKQ
jgi:hypothetical protein